jgi:L-lactate utilization protein LutB
MSRHLQDKYVETPVGKKIYVLRPNSTRRVNAVLELNRLHARVAELEKNLDLCRKGSEIRTRVEEKLQARVAELEAKLHEAGQQIFYEAEHLDDARRSWVEYIGPRPVNAER